jgi:hypothetical protein
MIRPIRGETADENDKAPKRKAEISREDYDLDRDTTFICLRHGLLRECSPGSESAQANADSEEDRQEAESPRWQSEQAIASGHKE